MQSIRVAVAGLGFIGPAHIEALRRLPGIEVVAISDYGLELAQAKAAQLGVPQAYGTFEELLAHPGLDAVHICTPNDLHFPMAKAALAAGLHVIVEKPLAMTATQGRELVELAHVSGKVHAIHFNIRYYPLIRHMRRLRETGALGEVYSVIGTYLQDWLFYATDYNWRLEPDRSGDSRAIADIGSHLLDLIEYITGLRVSSVMADFNTVHPIRKKPLKPVETYAGKMLKPEDYADVPVKTEDYASVLLRFDNGHKGVITVSQVAAGRKNRINLEIAGSQQSLAWCSEQPNEIWIGQRDTPNQVLLRDPSLVDPAAGRLISFPGGHNEGFPDTSKQLFKEVYAAIRAGEPPVQPPYPTFDDGLRELELCDAILASQAQEAWVAV